MTDDEDLSESLSSQLENAKEVENFSGANSPWFEQQEQDDPGQKHRSLSPDPDPIPDDPDSAESLQYEPQIPPEPR